MVNFAQFILKYMLNSSNQKSHIIDCRLGTYSKISILLRIKLKLIEDQGLWLKALICMYISLDSISELVQSRHTPCHRNSDRRPPGTRAGSSSQPVSPPPGSPQRQSLSAKQRQQHQWHLTIRQIYNIPKNKDSTINNTLLQYAKIHHP